MPLATAVEGRGLGPTLKAHLTGSSENSNNEQQQMTMSRGLMDEASAEAAAMAMSSRVFVSGGSGRSRGLGTPTPPPAISTNALLTSTVTMEDQRRGLTEPRDAANAMEAQPPKLESPEEPERGLTMSGSIRKTQRRRSPPQALALGGLATQGKQMHLGLRPMSAFSPRVSSPLSALAASASHQDLANGVTNPFDIPGLPPTPRSAGLIPPNRRSPLQQLAKRIPSSLRSLPSSPTSLHPPLRSISNPFGAWGRGPTGINEPTPVADLQVQVEGLPILTTQSMDGLEQPPRLTLQTGEHDLGRGAVAQPIGLAQADQTGWANFLQDMLEGKNGFQVQEAVAATPETLSADSEHADQVPTYPHHSPGPSTRSSTSLSVSAGTGQTPVLSMILPSVSTRLTSPSNQSSLGTPATSISLDQPLEGLSLASAVSEVPPRSLTDHQQAAVPLDDLNRPQVSVLGSGYDLARQLRQQTQLHTPSLEGQSDRTRLIQAMEDQPMDVTPHSGSAAENAGLTGHQQPQPMTMGGLQAGGFPLWNSAPHRQPPLDGQGQPAGLGLSGHLQGQTRPMQGLAGPGRQLSMSAMSSNQAPGLPQGMASMTAFAGTQRPRLKAAASTSSLSSRKARPTFIPMPTSSLASLTLPPAPLTSPGVSRANNPPQLSPAPPRNFGGPLTGPVMRAAVSPMASPSQNFPPATNEITRVTTPDRPLHLLTDSKLRAPPMSAPLMPRAIDHHAGSITMENHNPYFPPLPGQDGPQLPASNHHPHSSYEPMMYGSQSQTPTLRGMQALQQQNHPALLSPGPLSMPQPRALPAHLPQGELLDSGRAPEVEMN